MDFHHWPDGLREWLEQQFRHLNDRHDSLERQMEKFMSALTDLQTADASLQAEVATFLQDIATELQSQDPDIEKVVSDINAEVSQLQSADPANAQPATPPASGS